MSKQTLPQENHLKFTDGISKKTETYNLSKGERFEIHFYYKTRVIRMERDQNTPVVETAILDSCEYKKSLDKKFNQKNFLKFMAKKVDYKYEKLYSGLQKRRSQRRWAKRDFLKCRGITTV